MRDVADAHLRIGPEVLERERAPLPADPHERMPASDDQHVGLVGEHHAAALGRNRVERKDRQIEPAVAQVVENVAVDPDDLKPQARCLLEHRLERRKYEGEDTVVRGRDPEGPLDARRIEHRGRRERLELPEHRVDLGLQSAHARRRHHPRAASHEKLVAEECARRGERAAHGRGRSAELAPSERQTARARQGGERQKHAVVGKRLFSCQGPHPPDLLVLRPKGRAVKSLF